jgi:hypothetical protein
VTSQSCRRAPVWLRRDGAWTSCCSSSRIGSPATGSGWPPQLTGFGGHEAADLARLVRSCRSVSLLGGGGERLFDRA